MKKIEIPVKTVSILNTREHWSKRAKRAKLHRKTAFIAVKSALKNAKLKLPATILMIRCGAKKMDDDNLAASLKAVRDGVADAIGIDDADQNVRYQYTQQIGKYTVIIEITESADPPS